MAMSGSPFDTPHSFGYGAIESAKIPAGFHAPEAVITARSSGFCQK
jgi:hypothetical protein